MKHSCRITSIALFFLFNYSARLIAQEIGHSTVTFIDPARDNRQIKTELYYPALAAGEDTPIAPGVFPLLVYGHGFVMTTSAYENIWTDLVPEGYIVALPTTEGSFAPSHASFGLDLAFLVTEIQQHGAGNAVPSAGVANTSAVMGHSMGGGCAFLAAQNNTTITTTVSFAAANTNPSAIAAAQQVSVPTLVFSGTNDCIAPPASQQDALYDATEAVSKTQVYITGGGHCYFADYNFNCAFGEATCAPAPAITREQQHTAISEYLKLWLARYLKNDCDKGLAFQDSLASGANITYRQSQPIACLSKVEETTGNIPDLFPNPFTRQILVKNATGLEYFQLSNAWGQTLWAGQNIQQQDFSALPNGLYGVLVSGPGGKYGARLIKQ